MHIRPLKHEDIIQLKQVHLAAMEATFGFYTPEENAARMARIQNQTYTDRDEAYLVAVGEAGTVLGFASWKTNQLGSLFVHPNAQNRGVGRRLFQACEEAARQHGHTITTLNATLNARTFYAKLGFKTRSLSFRDWHGTAIPRIAMSRFPEQQIFDTQKT